MNDSTSSALLISSPAPSRARITVRMMGLLLGAVLSSCAGGSNEPLSAQHEAIALRGLTPTEQAQMAADPSQSTPGVPAMAQDVSDNDIARIFNDGKRFPHFAQRSLEELRQCTSWPEPASPDLTAHSWYRAATSLNAVKLKTAEQYRQMLVLYEAAARRGHYRAMLHLIALYTDGSTLRYNLRILPEPDKARMWIHEGLRREWPGALEWLATAYWQGAAGYPRDERWRLAYLQRAADLGVALAQYQLGLYYEHKLNQMEKGEALYACAGWQGTVSAASRKIAIIQGIYKSPEEALQLYQLAVMSGGEGGGKSAFSLSYAFSNEQNHEKEELNTQPDPIRRAAYMDLEVALRGGKDSQGIRHEGNRFLRFPRLNEVLPLPPAEVTEWNGIDSAMSPHDAAYYQDPLPPEHYIGEIREAGYLVPDDYLPEPIPLTFDE